MKSFIISTLVVIAMVVVGYKFISNNFFQKEYVGFQHIEAQSLSLETRIEHIELLVDRLNDKLDSLLESKAHGR